MLWLQVQGKTESTDTTCNLVCDLIGGASFATDLIEENQKGVTFEAVAQVYTASTWLMGKAKDAGHYTAVKPGGSASASSGKEAAASTSSPSALAPHVRAQDLDGRDWGDKCADKKGVRAKLDTVQPLTRLWSAARMTRYCSELVLNHERLETTCRNLKSTGKHPGVTPGAANDTEHPDYGLDKFCTLQSMAVMQSGFGQGSRFQNAIYLKYSATDHTRISIADFGSPKEATTTTFEAGRSTPEARSQLCRWLGGFQLFYRAFSGPAFQSPLDSLDQFDDIFLLFRVSLLLSNFSTDINTQERSDLLPDLVLSSSEANGHLLETYGKMFIPDASTLSNGWTNNGHSLYYSRDVGQHADVVHRVLGAPAPAADAAGGKKRDASEASLIADPNTEAAKKVQRQGRLHCSFHLAGKLGVKDSNGAQMSCSAGEGCPYQHTTQLTALT
ncbi:hypothetical protein B484DRAFT_410397, partial [Ochromonadaceae sp. CCMP2298]